MYKDFKKSESLDTGFVGGSGILWMFSGIVLGLLVGLGMYYFTNNNSSALSMVGTVQNKIKQAQRTTTPNRNLVSYKKPNTNNQKAEQKARQTKFSYYAVLPTLDVPVDYARPIDTSLQAVDRNQNTQKVAQHVDPAKPAQQQRNITRNSSKDAVKKGDYLLQVASYKTKNRANLTRGRLTKNGIDAYIQEKKIKGKMWYRVVAGPVGQRSIKSWKNSAEKMGHRPLVISLR
ncbi:MAG: SPOR domain-containing protein [Cocleimonas sp.]